MASKTTGVITKGKHKFRLDFDTFCTMQDETDQSVVELVNELGNEALKQGIPSPHSLRKWVRWAMLSDEPETTLEEAQAFCKKIGYAEANELVAQLLIVSKLVADPADQEDADQAPVEDEVGNAPETEPEATPAST